MIYKFKAKFTFFDMIKMHTEMNKNYRKCVYISHSEKSIFDKLRC